MSDSDKIIPIPKMKDVELAASEWIMRLDDGDVSAEDIAAFQVWCNDSDLNRITYERLQSLWGDFDAVDTLNDYAVASEADIQSDVISVARKRRIVNTLAIAAVFLICILGASFVLQVEEVPNQTPLVAYHTKVGQQKNIVLSDGSSIILNTDSLVEVSYSDTDRTIQLVKGEAYFDVTPDKHRPFSVYAGKGIVTAVGTAFSVHLVNNLVDVVVEEGKVVLASAQSSVNQVTHDDVIETLIEVKAGQRAVFDEEVQNVDPIGASALERELVWRDGMLNFTGEPLSDVISEMGRYTDIEVLILDKELRDLPIAGYFKIGELEALFEALEIMANIEIERYGQSRITLAFSKEEEAT